MQACKPLGEHLRAFPGVMKIGWFCSEKFNVRDLDSH